MGFYIDSGLKNTTSADFRCDLETPMFSVRSCPDLIISAPACQPPVGQSAPTIVSPRDRRDQPVSALLSLHLKSWEYIAGRCTFSSAVAGNSALLDWM